MKLYTHPFSPAGRNVLVVAALLGTHLDVRAVDAAAGEQRTPEYMKLNPNGLFPTLVDGDFVLWESNAITQYLAARGSESPLWPQDERVRSDIARWQFWELAHFNPAVRPFMWENVFKPMLGQGEPDLVELDKAEGPFLRFGSILNAHLKGRRWLVGDRLTLADVAVASSLMYWEPARMPLEKMSEVKRWLGQIEALPAWEQTTPSLVEGAT